MLLHHGKHHAGYVTRLNELIEGTHYAGLGLETIITSAATDVHAKAIFENAAQIWNHDFYWHSMQPFGSMVPHDQIRDALEREFGSEDQFRTAFTKAASELFGSGWVWLIARSNGRLEIIHTNNADTPITTGAAPLLVIDIWEHAYYLDYHNHRSDYVSAWLDRLVNWQFAAQNLRLLW